ncbi:MAG: nicotinate-nucleotide adenylyltransferase [Deltaproteobacteria bacterium]|nr:MAG: nicotinate-nucleotide adenylyltransferase [Deltaproteobacteria bacterium]
MEFELGMIHGRFHPFHLEHLRYLRLAERRCERLIVGITNPDPSTIVPDERSSHRHRPEENPYTFFERLLMVDAVIAEEGIDRSRVHIVPFPIHHPERWRYYAPENTVMFVVAYSDWERSKAERLRRAGYRVELVESFEKGISGTEVRRLMREGGDWKRLVPASVARLIEGWKIEG